jgi:hypothetical protein
MVGLIMALAVIAAVLTAGLRRYRRRQGIRNRAGVDLEKPICVERFDEIDTALEHRRCAWCDGALTLAGESSAAAGERRLRVVRLVCEECERDERVYFDVTRIFH